MVQRNTVGVASQLVCDGLSGGPLPYRLIDPPVWPGGVAYYVPGTSITAAPTPCVSIGIDLPSAARPARDRPSVNPTITTLYTLALAAWEVQASQRSRSDAAELR